MNCNIGLQIKKGLLEDVLHLHAVTFGQMHLPITFRCSADAPYWKMYHLPQEAKHDAPFITEFFPLPLVKFSLSYPYPYLRLRFGPCKKGLTFYKKPSVTPLLGEA